MDFQGLAGECVAELKVLKENLRQNEIQILAHLSAVKEVTGTMVDLIKGEEADGTYGEWG